MIDAGVDALKIEGRNRSPEYVKVATECYREAVDAIEDGKFSEELKKELIKKLGTVYNRKFSSGFLLGAPTNDDWTNIYGSNATKNKVYIGKVRNYYTKIGAAEIMVLSDEIKVGDNVMIQGNSTGVFEQKVDSIQINHKSVKTASKGQRAAIKLDRAVRPNDKVFIFQ